MISKTKIFFLVIALFLVSCKTETYQAQFYNENNSALVQPVENMQYDAKSKLLYSISNDAKNVYVHIRVADEPLQRKIMFLGLNVWIDTLGKKNEHFGLKYPVITPGQMKIKPQMRKNSDFTKNIIQEKLNELNEMQIYGLEYHSSVNFAYTNNPTGITATMKITNDHVLHYRATFPLKYIGNKNSFSVGIEVNEPDLSSRPTMMQGGNKQMGPRMAGGPPMGGRPQMQKNAGTNMNPDLFPKLWVKNIILATINTY